MSKRLSTLIVAGAACIVAVSTQAAEQDVKAATQSFSVKLGATRVIYDPDSAGSSLEVTNPQDYPILVQSKVTGDDKKTAANFMVTPPVFRLDGGQQSRLRIVRVGGEYPKDRESLSWLCVTGVPPKADDEWAQGEASKNKSVSLNIQMSISSCIKLLVRPSSLGGGPEKAGASLIWSQKGGKLEVNNPSPYYMSLTEVKVGTEKVTSDYVPPFGKTLLTVPGAKSGEAAQWKVITDYGGASQAFQAKIQ
ncbi:MULTISPECIES: fimbria/pilus periplasmic chaperone [Lelliottia]|uniref:Pilus assembly protein n=1 Tax=Lelliottia aquatilis TaxID=2080838 RepID=A0ABX4ZXC0_9ENTR|nr:MULTISPECIES: fimbria/pilus periplasmic chaperone [Lelliottia]POZ16198.1 pilus assembly protein [Lelliottia aquatilis]POZ16217.1 pilus assembly protein [Lelliottia sp. 7254-16]POZ20531.1 pilus assembly protein [Lelliottia aquatilis]POZ22038.1 pilus assembly protein [Lelliottia aquatilis]POZ33116.1 pilus assembly protein [Lelliottia aquatilis]